MPEVVAGIVAHEARRARANLLHREVSDYFQTGMFLDDGSLGCDYNHLRAWESIAAATDAPWCMVLEDDAAPIRQLGYHLGQALYYSPAPVVSLYLGRGRPVQWQRRITRAVAAGRPWIVASHLLHCVAVCVRTELVMGMLARVREAIESPARKPIDEAISEWLLANSLPVAYTNPSLVDHADLAPVAVHRYHQPQLEPRVAHQVGVPESWIGQFSIM
ncbi:MAG TPA: hypothetical protein VJ777_07095 [Mycobacterium sp.]|nr:hypothetical protein [Mycobacterium sp.]